MVMEHLLVYVMLTSLCLVAPEIQLPNRRIGQSRDRETILECVITAFPLATSHWAKDGRRIPNSSKYRLEAYEDGEHRLTLSLKVHVANDDDFGEYVCSASNSHGSAKQSMHLYGRWCHRVSRDPGHVCVSYLTNKSLSIGGHRAK